MGAPEATCPSVVGWLASGCLVLVEIELEIEDNSVPAADAAGSTGWLRELGRRGDAGRVASGDCVRAAYNPGKYYVSSLPVCSTYRTFITLK